MSFYNTEDSSFERLFPELAAEQDIVDGQQFVVIADLPSLPPPADTDAGYPQSPAVANDASLHPRRGVAMGRLEATSSRHRPVSDDGDDDALVPPARERSRSPLRQRVASSMAGQPGSQSLGHRRLRRATGSIIDLTTPPGSPSAGPPTTPADVSGLATWRTNATAPDSDWVRDPSPRPIEDADEEFVLGRQRPSIVTSTPSTSSATSSNSQIDTFQKAHQVRYDPRLSPVTPPNPVPVPMCMSGHNDFANDAVHEGINGMNGGAVAGENDGVDGVNEGNSDECGDKSNHDNGNASNDDDDDDDDAEAMYQRLRDGITADIIAAVERSVQQSIVTARLNREFLQERLRDGLAALSDRLVNDQQVVVEHLVAHRIRLDDLENVVEQILRTVDLIRDDVDVITRTARDVFDRIGAVFGLIGRLVMLWWRGGVP